MEERKSRLENLEIMNELRKTYFGKRVFVTGHTGFKGSWLIKILNDFGAIVKGYALAPGNETNLFSEINGDVLCESVIGDLRDRMYLKKALLNFQPDYVFHLAAQPLVRLSYEIPSETFEVNAIGTANLLDAIRALEKKCNILLITTDKVYYNNEWEYPYRETDKLGGYDPYSASKACCELLIDSYKKSFFNLLKYEQHKKAITVCRAGNVIGGGDWSKDRIIPDIIRAIYSNEEILIRNPNSIRPWQHVLEPLVGYLKLGSLLNSDPYKYSGAWNLGPQLSDNLNVLSIAQMAVSILKKGKIRIVEDRQNHHEANLLKLDISKITSETDWRPRMNTEDAISLTVNWYKAFYEKNIPASQILYSDIDYYFRLLNEK
jgi:CDP-glucose 4,6-dehydratase